MKSFKLLLLLLGALVFISTTVFAQDIEEPQEVEEAQEIEEGEHKCAHDEHQALEEVDDMDVEEDFSSVQGEGRLLAGSYRNLRVHVNSDKLSSASSSLRTYIRNEMVPPVIDWFEGALRVKYPISGTLKRTSVCGYSAPSDIRRGVSTDFYFLLTHYSQSSSTVASASYCSRASGSGRPIIAQVRFNTRQVKPARGDVLLHERHIYLLIHEMMHAFGVSGSLFNYYLDSNGRRMRGHVRTVSLNGQRRTVLDVPSLTSRVRKHFGCSSVPGVVMEDDGGSGTVASHLEKKFYLYEVMTSGTYYGRRVSQFSLGVLEATGWYAPDYDFAEPFYWGQGQGCGFHNTKCSSSRAYFDEFCTGSSRRCAHNGRNGGRCAGDSLTDSCRYVLPSLSSDCDNSDARDYARLPSLQVFGRGANSKCFEGTLNTRSSTSLTTFCFKYTCVGSGSNTELQVKVGSKSVTCTREGSVSVSGYYGSIKCPDPMTFCNTVGKLYCPRNCLNRGSCVNGKCQCRSGYTGVDCALLR